MIFESKLEGNFFIYCKRASVMSLMSLYLRMFQWLSEGISPLGVRYINTN